MMRALRRRAAIVVAFGVISLFGMVVVSLALTDIWHGEADVRAEWAAVRAGLVSILLFQATALAVLVGMLRASSRSE